MRKKVVVEKEVVVCDFCGKEDLDYVIKCGVCGKEGCGSFLANWNEKRGDENHWRLYIGEAYDYKDGKRFSGVYICRECAEKEPFKSLIEFLRKVER